MNKEEIIKEIVRLLEGHFSGIRGYIGQDPYRSDFFKLFNEAYRNAYLVDSEGTDLTGDHLADLTIARLPVNEDKNPEHKTILLAFAQQWNNWRYAILNIKK
ncbi:MAG: hypothetical protein V1933_00125 [Candidatus Omnitrophota bacterium]